jgi:hypothetical protein
MKVILLVVFATVVSSQSLNETKILDYVNDLIIDWNAKHNYGTEKDVAIINLGSDTTFYNELLKRILHNNPTLLPSQELCLTDEDIYKDTVALMIFITSSIQPVSKIFVLWI